MYQQKFMPYNQMNEVYEEQQYQEQDSEPLIEEVDPDYQPNQKQVKQYAIDVLGMNLPEDERLLYLAREGLKAPIPENWQPYQGRDGQVYYKHKITQQKTFEHPTDVEYRKKYIQQKQRAARKNLKSMNLKGNPLAGFGQPLGPSFGGLGPKLGINPLGLSNISSQDHQTLSKQVSKLDPKLQQKLRNQVQELEQKLETQFAQFEDQRKLIHEKNMKKYKADFQQSLSELKSQKSSSFSYEKLLKQQKERIKQRLKQAYDDRFKDQFSDVQKKEQKKYTQFVQLYQEDNKIKVKKYQADKQREFTQRLKKIQSLQKKLQQTKKSKQKQRQVTLAKIRQQYQQQGNEQIQQATKQTYMKQLTKIKESHQNKLREFEQKLDIEYQQMRNILGHDPNKMLQQMAQKRNRLKKISQQKMQSLKKKQYQKVNQQFSENLQREMKKMQASLQKQNNNQIQAYKQEMQQKLLSMKQSLQKQISQRIMKQTQQIYSSAKKSTSQYEKQKNKKILLIRDKFIQQIVSKSENKNQQLDMRMGMKQKQEMIQNKEELINSIARQIQLETCVLRELKMNKVIATCGNVDAELKRLVAEYNIVYKPQQFIVHEKRFNQLKHKYKQDKVLLGSMMAQLQNSALFLPYINSNNQKLRNSLPYDQPTFTRTSSTTGILTKQYNKDVRTMRKNQQMLNRYQVTLRKAQLNDEQALKQLQSSLQFQYEQISLRGNNVRANDQNQLQLREIDNGDQQKNNNRIYSQSSSSSNNGYQSIEDKLQQHSKFLSNVKAELNRKLYKVRNNNYFRV